MQPAVTRRSQNKAPARRARTLVRAWSELSLRHQSPGHPRRPFAWGRRGESNPSGRYRRRSPHQTLHKTSPCGWEILRLPRKVRLPTSRESNPARARRFLRAPRRLQRVTSLCDRPRRTGGRPSLLDSPSRGSSPCPNSRGGAPRGGEGEPAHREPRQTMHQTRASCKKKDAGLPGES